MTQNKGNELTPGQALHATGHHGTIYSIPDAQGGVYALEYQFDGNLVLYKNALGKNTEAVDSAHSNIEQGVFYMNEFLNDSNSANPCFKIVHENAHPVRNSYYVTQCYWPAIKDATLKLTNEGKLIQLAPNGRSGEFILTDPIFTKEWEEYYKKYIRP